MVRFGPTTGRHLIVSVLVTLMALGGLSSGAFAQTGSPTTITATIDRAVVTQTQRIQLKVEAKGNFDSIQRPLFRDFVVVGRARTGSSGFSISFGRGRTKRSQSKSVTYTLRAKRAGKLTIEPVKLLKDGNVIKQSAPITVQVIPASQISRGPARAILSIGKSTLGLNERTTLKLTVQGSDLGTLELKAPASRNLEISDRANKSQRKSVRDARGRFMEEITLTYGVAPKKIGVHTIQPAVIYRDGNIVARSKPIRVKVTAPKPKKAVSANTARDLSRHAGEAFIVHAAIARNSYYVGEPFVITWELYSDPFASIVQGNLVDSPKLKGLLAQDIRVQNEDETTRVVGNRRMRVRRVKYQLARGLEPGEVTVDSMVFKLQGTTQESFGFRWYRVSSDPFKLKIKPLPKEGRPQDFNAGQVGQFSMNVSLTDENGGTPKKMATGRRAILEINITGKGNLSGVKSPVLSSNDGNFTITSIAADSDDNVVEDRTGIHGQRVFKYLIVPQKPGRHTTPSVVFDFFDPVTSKYRKLTKPGVTMEVTGNAMSARITSSGAPIEDIGPILQDPELKHHDMGHFAGTTTFWLFILFPLALLFLVEAGSAYRKHLAKDPSARRAKGAGRQAAKRLKVAKETLAAGDVKAFFGEISRCIIAYFEEKTALPATGLTHDALKREARALGYPDGLMEKVIAELENCDFARFAPAAEMDTQMRDALARTEGLMQQLDKIKPQKKGAS